MDFSNANCALRTLKKRTHLTDSVIEACKVLQDLVESFPAGATATASVEEGMDSNLQWQFNEMVVRLVHGKRWETLAVALVVSKDYASILNEEATKELMQSAMIHLEHREPRLRKTIAQLLGKLAEKQGIEIYLAFQERIIESIECNMTRSLDYAEEDLDHEMPSHFALDPLASPISPPPSPLSASHALDETSGWKSLETSLLALNWIVAGCGEAFMEQGYLTPRLLSLMTTQSVAHINRHVRAVGLDAITSMANMASLSFLIQNSEVCDVLATNLAMGLDDDWSQVRYAACVATRAFLLKVGDSGRKKYYGTLVPKMCLNRYYFAEGVRLYSQTTWKLVMGTHGKEVVASVIDDVVAYYIEAAAKDNQAVRESACRCIAELGLKVDQDAVRPYVARLLASLVSCFRDDTWPVRDAACVSCSELVQGFPLESRPFLETLYALWIEHVSDNIWSVRENAARALGNVMRALGQDAVDRVCLVIEEYLPKAKEQAPMSLDEYRKKQADEKRHTGNQVYSCCSFAPKTRNHCAHQHKELWEFTDGAIYLVRQLSEVAPERAIAYLSDVADVSMLRHFPQTALLQETIWKQVPYMCRGVGKKVFKRYLELFLDPLVFTLASDHRLASHAAGECVRLICSHIGSTIFEGRLSHNETWKAKLSPFLEISPV